MISEIATGVTVSIVCAVVFWAWRYFWRSPSKAQMLFQRLADLQSAHGLTGLQILSLVPSDWNWIAKTVTDPEQLAAQWGAAQSRWFAETFRLNQGWLDGRTTETCEPIWGYKHLRQLGESLSREGWLQPDLRMTILAEESSSNELGSYHILFSLPIAELSGETTVYKHALVDGEWMWSHYPCRIETKAVARWFAMHLHHLRAIPIVRIPRAEFRHLTDRQILPGQFFHEQYGGLPRFENRILASSESHLVEETDEFPAVIRHLEQSGLLESTTTMQPMG